MILLQEENRFQQMVSGAHSDPQARIESFKRCSETCWCWLRKERSMHILMPIEHHTPHHSV